MDIDIIGDILKKMSELQPDSKFVQSLYNQYRERGSLSKKQLEGLENKASKTGAIPISKLATLQAIILRKHAKHKSDLPANPQSLNLPSSLELTNTINNKISAILQKYPAHKRVLYFKIKNEKEGLSITELNELYGFFKILV